MGKTVASCLCCDSEHLFAHPAIWMPFVAHRALGCPPLTIDASWGLRTIPQGIAYSTCKSLLCLDCGHLFVDYRFDDREMQSLYTDYRGKAYTHLRELYEPGYADRNSMLCSGSGYKGDVEDFLSPFLPADSLSILDWGGDTGVNTPFEGRRYRLDIYDPSAKPLQHGTSVNSADSAKDGSYDLIVLSEVLEHIPFPADTLKLILQKLTHQSILYVEFPFESLQRSWEGSNNLAEKKFYWHEHINFFSQQSSRRLFQKCGLQVVAERTLALSSDLKSNSECDNEIFMFALRREYV